MKKAVFALAAAAIALAACNNAPKENDARQDAPRPNAQLKIAYVEVDSVMNRYTFAKEMQEALQTKAQNVQNTLASKQQNIEAASTKLQQDYQANALTQEQAQQRQDAIQRQYNDWQSLNQRLSNELQAETDKFNAALSDSIQHFLAAYNKDKKYSIILTKVGDNILFADKKLDITDEVIAGLNKAYKPAKKTEVKKEEGKK
ncbi:MAG: OmpH family outer membrane protein [Prevotella sp.]|nr:OmpH family outer membrane protein [Prevotella sp.]